MVCYWQSDNSIISIIISPSLAGCTPVRIPSFLFPDQGFADPPDITGSHSY